MELKELVAMYFERGNAMQTLWGLYITIVLGLVAFFGAAPVSVKKLSVAGILSLGFIGFAVVNEDAIHDITRTRCMTQTIILNYQAKTQEDRALVEMVKTINPPPVLGTRIFHFTADFFVLAAVWVLTLRRKDFHHTAEKS
jgi:hypothetical protein